MRIIRGKKALVTGAASGIGRAIAIALAQEGADLFLVDINEAKLLDVARAVRGHGVEAITHVCDLAESAQIGAAVERVRTIWGGLNILINNAGVAYYGQTHLMTDAQWQRIMAVNLMAPIQLFRALLPMLVAADDAHILNVCSLLGLVGWRKVTAYQTTKFGLVGFTNGLRTEYHRDNFGVTALCPGFVQSSLIDDRMTGEPGKPPAMPAWLCATPEAVAARAIRAIRRNQGMVLITPAAHFYWRLMRICPALVDWLLREGWRRRDRLPL
jgi:3-oxoacyl-[acyl-carrier protein] reductase